MKIDKELENYYKDTDYIVYPNNIFQEGLTINIDLTTDLLDKYLESMNLSTWVFITAYNPYSNIQNEQLNHISQNKLINEIKDKYIYFSGEGKGRNSDWEPEKSILILGITEIQALELKSKYQQNAVVYGEIYHKAKLI